MSTNKLSNTLRSIPSIFLQSASIVSTQHGMQWLKTIQGKTPVRTGNLRRGNTLNITHNPNMVTMRLYNKVHYAIPVNYGHKSRSGLATKGKGSPIRFVRGRYYFTGDIPKQSKIHSQMIMKHFSAKISSMLRGSTLITIGG